MGCRATVFWSRISRLPEVSALVSVIWDLEIGEIERSAHTWLRGIYFDTVTLNGADPRAKVLRLNSDALATIESPASEGSGDHRAYAAQCECAINTQARLTEIALCRHGCELQGERLLQIFNSLTGAHRSGNYWRFRKNRFAQTISNLFGDVLKISQIAFREGDHCSLHAEISQNLQMLFRLRHPAVVRGDNEQREVN